uniref:Uncharacterized protein n=1 Tax=Anguilla anguilla TaxID=7936 RepID=A0A0E9QZG7_ANGAN
MSNNLDTENEVVHLDKVIRSSSATVHIYMNRVLKKILLSKTFLPFLFSCCLLLHCHLLHAVKISRR